MRAPEASRSEMICGGASHNPPPASATVRIASALVVTRFPDTPATTVLPSISKKRHSCPKTAWAYKRSYAQPDPPALRFGMVLEISPYNCVLGFAQVKRRHPGRFWRWARPEPCDIAAVEIQFQATVEINFQRAIARFSRRMFHEEATDLIATL